VALFGLYSDRFPAFVGTIAFMSMYDPVFPQVADMLTVPFL
jgi:hypothetical protein